jgi:hypothetical protein
MKVRVLSAVAMSAGDASRLAASARPSPPPYQPLSLSLLSALFFWNSRRRNHEQNGGERGGVLKGVVGGVGTKSCASRTTCQILCGLATTR